MSADTFFFALAVLGGFLISDSTACLIAGERSLTENLGIGIAGVILFGAACFARLAGWGG